MAPSNQYVVTLKVEPGLLRPFSNAFETPSSVAKKRKRPTKKEERQSLVNEPDNDDGSVAGSVPSSAAVGANSIVGSSGASMDPILGNLPRSLRAAPVANTSGLDLNKTPCRKWRRQPLVIRTFTGFSCNFVAWTSEFTEAEWQAKTEREAAAEAANAERQRLEEPSTPELGLKPKVVKDKVKRSKKITLKLSKPEEEGEEREEVSEIDSEPSEPASEPASEP